MKRREDKVEIILHHLTRHYLFLSSICCFLSRICCADFNIFRKKIPQFEQEAGAYRKRKDRGASKNERNVKIREFEAWPYVHVRRPYVH